MTRHLPAALILACSLVAMPAWATPGDIVSAELERTMSPADVDLFIATLYDGYDKPAALCSVDVWAVKFESVYPDGAPAVAFAQVFIPRLDGEPRTTALYAFGPGSTGLTDACRPSREHVAGIRWGLYRAHVLSHVGQGMIGVIPDYLGFGDPERDQYYMVAEAEASAMLHAIRAATLMARRGGYAGIGTIKNFVAGFSQGGHAAFAAADWRTRLAPDVQLAGIIGYGPSTDLVALFKEFPDVAPMALYTFRNLYGAGTVDPNLALASRFAPSLDIDVTRQCVGGMQSYYPIDPTKLFNERFSSSLLGNRLDDEFPGIARILRLNSTGLTRHGVPALILQGTDDIVVSVASQTAFAEASRRAGNAVELRVMQDVRHDTRQAGFYQAQEWMKSKL